MDLIAVVLVAILLLLPVALYSAFTSSSIEDAQRDAISEDFDQRQSQGLLPWIYDGIERGWKRR
jgi:flagellar basal body-associated protein FliL